MRLSPVVQSLTEPLLSPLVSAITGVFGGGFSPTSLFADGSKGVVYDNNDLSGFYLDSTGVTPATVNGLVGLQLDKSGNLALGADFCVNGGFDTDTVWTKGGGWAISGGVATKTPGVANTLQQAGSLTVGKAYKITYTVSGRTAGTCAGALFGGTTVFEPLIGSNGARSCILIAVTGNITFGITADSTFDGSIDNFTIQELPGFHRYQTTTGSKPVLRGTPVGSNLVTNGDFASDTVWSKGAGWSIGSGVATKVAGSPTSLLQSVSLTSGKVYRFTYTATVTAGGVQPIFSGGTSAFGTLRSASGTFVDYITANSGNTQVGLTTNASFAGTIDNIEIVDVSAGQVTAPYGLQYDGVDDFLQTAAVNFTATDKMFVCAGVRKLSDAARAVVVELGNAAAASIFRIEAPNSAAGNNYNFASGGSTLVAIAVSSFVNPITNVVTCIGNISGDSASIRVNGVLAGTEPGDQGTGNYSNNILYFGRRGGTSLPFVGLDFGFVICGKTLTSTQIANTERWMSYRTGVTL